MSKQFTREIFLFLKDCRDDAASGKLSHLAFTLAFTIADHINEHAGYAVVGQAALAREIGTSTRTIGRATRELVEAGRLTADRTGSPNGMIRYRMADRTCASEPDRTCASEPNV